MKTRGARAGFTLIEVLVTMVVLAILLSMVGSILVSALSTQKKVEATLLRERVGSGVLDLFARDVASLFAYDLQGSFVGTDERGGPGDADRVSFVTARDPAVKQDADADPGAAAREAQPRASAFFADPTQATDDHIRRDPVQLTKLTYFVRESQSHPGLLTLFRAEQRYVKPANGTAAQTPQPGRPAPQVGEPSPAVLEVFDRVKSFNLRYLARTGAPPQQQFEWRDRWDDPQQIPAAIEVTLEIVPDPREVDAAGGPDRPRKVYRTVVGIPTSNPSPDQQQPSAIR